MKDKVHTFTITVRMDKKCSRRVAMRETRACIYGRFYCGSREGDPETFRVARIGNANDKHRSK